MWSIAPRAYVVDLAVVDLAVVDLAVVDWASWAWVAGVTLVSVAILSLPFAVSNARRHFTEDHVSTPVPVLMRVSARRNASTLQSCRRYPRVAVRSSSAPRAMTS